MEEKKILDQALEEYKQGEYSLAIDLYEKAIKINPNHELTYVKLSNCYRNLRNFKKALELIDKAISQKKNFFIGYVEKADLLITLKNSKEAQKCLEIAKKQNPNYVKIYCVHAKNFLLKNNIEEALNYYDKALQLNENYFDAHYGIGVSLAARGAFSEALSSFDKAIEIYEKNIGGTGFIEVSDYGKALYFKASCLSHLKSFKQALAPLNKAIEIEENKETLKKTEAAEKTTSSFAGSQKTKCVGEISLYIDKDEPEIKQIYNKLKKEIEDRLEKNSSANNVNSGETLQTNNLLVDSSNENFNKNIINSVSTNSNQSKLNSFNNISHINNREYDEFVEKGKEIQSKDKREAISFFDKALQINPEGFEALKLKANVYKLLDEKEKSLEYYIRAFNVNNQKNEEKLLLLNIANLFLALNSPKDAIKYYNTILNKEKGNPNALRGKAACLFTTNKFSEAIDVYDRILTMINSEDETSLFNKGVCYFSQGNYEEALNAYNQYVKVIPDNPNAYLNMAECEEELDRKGNAVSLYDKALGLLSEGDKDLKNEILYKKGFCLFETNELRRSQRCFEEIIKADKNYAKAYCGLGLCYSKDSNFTSAIAQFDKAISLESNAMFYLYKAFTLFDMKKEKEMKNCIVLCEKAVDKVEEEGIKSQIKDKIKKLKEKKK